MCVVKDIETEDNIKPKASRLPEGKSVLANGPEPTEQPGSLPVGSVLREPGPEQSRAGQCERDPEKAVYQDKLQEDADQL